MWILHKDTLVINVDNEADYAAHIAAGWQVVSDAEIVDAGMSGYEQIVGPHNTVIHQDGSIMFTPPQPPSIAELFERLRAETERRLASTDKFGMDDYPDTESRAAFRAYRAELRALNRQPGAPFDGGGEQTPWPAIPQL